MRPEKCNLKGIKIMKKLDRSSIDCAVDRNNWVVGTRWKDSNVLTILSNQYVMNPIQKCSRYSVKQKKTIEIIQPTRQPLSNYRIAFIGKKWYTPIVYWMRDAYLLAHFTAYNITPSLGSLVQAPWLASA